MTSRPQNHGSAGVKRHRDEALEIRRRPGNDLAVAVHQQIPADRDADDQPRQRDHGVVERPQERQQKFRFGLGVGHGFPRALRVLAKHRMGRPECIVAPGLLLLAAARRSYTARRKRIGGSAEMAEWFVAKASDLTDGDRRIVTAGKHEIGVFHKAAPITPTAITACIPAGRPAKAS